MKMLMKRMYIHIPSRVLPIPPVIIFKLAWIMETHRQKSLKLDYKGFELDEYREITKQL